MNIITETSQRSLLPCLPSIAVGLPPRSSQIAINFHEMFILSYLPLQPTVAEHPDEHQVSGIQVVDRIAQDRCEGRLIGIEETKVGVVITGTNRRVVETYIT